MVDTILCKNYSIYCHLANTFITIIFNILEVVATVSIHNEKVMLAEVDMLYKILKVMMKSILK